MEKHDIVIVGAGPGGLTAAKKLAKKDKDVLVLENVLLLLVEMKQKLFW